MRIKKFSLLTPSTQKLRTAACILLAGAAFVGCGEESAVQPEIPIEVKVSPRVVKLEVSARATFSAMVTGSDNTDVTWTATCGTISPGGIYDAPDEPGSCKVTATAAADDTVSATADVTVEEATVLPLKISPMEVTLAPGAEQTFELEGDAYDPEDVVWSASAGTIDENGLFKAPTEEQSLTVTAKLESDASVTAEAKVTVDAPVELTVPLTKKTMEQGGTFKFEAEIKFSDKGLKWSVKEAEGGTIDAEGSYTAPAANGTFTVVVESEEDGTKKVEIAVTVTDQLTIIVPATFELDKGATHTFEADVLNSDQGVTWTVEGTDAGTIDAEGKYTAPATAGEYTVVATSAEDGAVSAKIVVTVKG